jgi:hypothetical protein
MALDPKGNPQGDFRGKLRCRPLPFLAVLSLTASLRWVGLVVLGSLRQKLGG